MVLYLSHIDTKKEIAFKTLNEELLKDVILQMEKDLAMTAIDHRFESQTPDHLVKSLADVVAKADRNNRLADLLYRVDVNYQFDQIPNYEELALLLWNRVTQKVWFRRLYSKGDTTNIQ